MDSVIEGVSLTPLRIIETGLGDVYHAMRTDAPGYDGFGEVYFSSVPHLVVKDWKKHTRMTLNVVVPVGRIRFGLVDNRPESATGGRTMTVDLSPDHYYRLTVPPGIWMAFQGLSKDLNLLMNFANLPHDPEEALRLPTGEALDGFSPWEAE
jgi:dTDP-4-dehydrorhamnose 3,5-epimerase